MMEGPRREEKTVTMERQYKLTRRLLARFFDACSYCRCRSCSCWFCSCFSSLSVSCYPSSRWLLVGPSAHTHLVCDVASHPQALHVLNLGGGVVTSRWVHDCFAKRKLAGYIFFCPLCSCIVSFFLPSSFINYHHHHLVSVSVFS